MRCWFVDGTNAMARAVLSVETIHTATPNPDALNQLVSVMKRSLTPDANGWTDSATPRFTSAAASGVNSIFL